MMKSLAALAAAAALLVLSACGGSASVSEEGEASSSSQDTSQYPAQIGEVTLEAQPRAVVSLSPAITEWVADLGYEGQLAGISDYCDYPESLAQELPRCGTLWQMNQQEVDSLGADLVLASAPLAQEDQDYLELMEIPVLVLPPAQTMEELHDRYTDLARALGGETDGLARGEEVAAQLEDGMAQAASRVQEAVAQREGGSLTVILLREADTTMATGDTFEQTILEEMGLTNLAREYTGWQVPAQEAAALNPQLIIAHETITIPDLEQNPTYQNGQATIYDQVVNLDFQALERQSLRMVAEWEKIADFLTAQE